MCVCVWGGGGGGGRGGRGGGDAEGQQSDTTVPKRDLAYCQALLEHRPCTCRTCARAGKISTGFIQDRECTCDFILL